MAMDLTSIDWISIAFFAIIGLCIIVGIVRGGAKDFWRLLVQAIAIVVAFMLCHLFGNLFYNINPLHDVLYNPIRDFLLPIFGDDATMIVTADDLTVGVRSGFYTQLNLPEFVIKAYDAEVLLRMPEGEFEAIVPFVNGIVSLICTGLGFLIVYLVVIIIGGIITSAIFRASKGPDGKPKKPGAISRLLGIVVGAIKAAGIIWTICLVLNVFIKLNLPFIEPVAKMIGLGDDSVQSFAKWCITSPFFYDEILGFFFH